jgi:hypothetical protein
VLGGYLTERERLGWNAAIHYSLKILESIETKPFAVLALLVETQAK